MIDRETIGAIIAQYRKHGWIPRRVLLSEKLRKYIADIDAVSGEAEIRPSGLDAIWFTRSSRPGTTTWEIRRLSDPPFALVVVLPDDGEMQELEASLAQAEERMLDSAVKRSP